MAEINTAEQLADAWGGVVLSASPTEALQGKGVTIGEKLARRLAAPQAKSLAPKDRAALVRRLTERPGLVPERVRFRIGQAAARQAAATLPESEYDLVVGIKLDLVDQTLAGLYATLTWPNELPPARAAQLVDLDDLRDLSDDMPDMEGLAIGALHLVEPPTARADARRRLLVDQPFVLDLDVVGEGTPARTTVTTLRATLTFHVPLRTRHDPDNPGRLRIEFGGLFTEDLAGSRLQIHPESAIQPRSQQAFEAFELKITTGVGVALAAQPVSICPELDIPLGPLDG